MFGNTVCEVSLFYHQDLRFFTNHVCIKRCIFQKMIETSHTVLPNIQYCFVFSVTLNTFHGSNNLYSGVSIIN